MSNRMRSEFARLNTFKDWPRRVGISPLALAGAGFYYLGQEDRVMCFSCKGTVMCWEEGDDPRAEHQKHFPQCHFLRNAKTAGNIFYFDNGSFDNSTASDSAETSDSGYYDGSTQSDSAQPRAQPGATNDIAQPDLYHGQTNRENMRNEHSRLETLRSWPKKNIIDINKVAKAGLYFTGKEDKLQCAFCNGSMVNWATGDDPAEEHRKHFGQRCPFIRNNGHHKGANTNIELSSQLERLNIIADRPKNPDMANFDRRQGSFRNWPVEHNQNSQTMAEAGFYYIGTSDQVRCFFCNVGLSNWDPSDDPWKEHAKWSPKCGYLGLRPEPMDATQDDGSEGLNKAPATLEEENRRLKEERLCKVCRNRDSQVVFLPCGHIVTCDQCAPTVKRCLHKNCNKSVEGTVKAYMT